MAADIRKALGVLRQALETRITIPMAADIRKALAVLRQALETRITTPANQALTENPPWLKDLGLRPADLQGRYRWTQALRTVIAYRDAYGIQSQSILGGEPKNTAQRLHRETGQNRIDSIHRTGQSTLDRLFGSSPIRNPPAVGL